MPEHTQDATDGGATQDGATQDRRSRDRSLREIKRSEELHREIEQVAQIGGWEYDPESDTVTGTRQLFALLEVPPDGTFDLDTGLDFYPPDAREKVGRAVQQCLEKGVPFDLEVPLVTRKGTRRWVRVRGELRSGQSGPERMIGTLQDVSAEHDIRDTLEAEQAVLRKMYRITSDPDAPLPVKIRELIDLGREHLGLPYGFLTRIEDGTQRIVEARGTHPLLQAGMSCPLSRSYCRKTIEEKSLLAVQNAPEEDWARDPAYETFGLGAYIGAKVILEGDVFGTFCFAAHDAREEPFDDGERTFVEILSRWASYELQQKRAAEQLKNQNDRLDRLASVLAHDLRNPLNVARGRLGILKEDLADGAQAEGEEIQVEEADGHLAAVQRAHERIHMIIDDMMSLTRGGARLEMDDVEAVGLRNIAEDSWETVDTAQATLSVETPDEEEDQMIQADPGRLHQLLENLFRNAVEHGGEGASVRVGPLADGFFVEDDRTGIPEDRREKVFEASFSTREHGTGLGLSIVEAVAEAHGWDVDVTESQKGGARFEIVGGEGPESEG